MNLSTILTDTAGWSLLAGSLLPLLVAFVNRPGWAPATKRTIAYVAAGVVGVVTTLSTGELTSAKTLVTALAVVGVASQAAYKLLWKPTGAATAIEYNTTPAAHYELYGFEDEYGDDEAAADDAESQDA